MLLKNNEIYKKMEKIELLKKKNLFDIYFNDVFINLHADINKKVFYFFFDENENFLFMPILVSPIFQRKNDNFYFETVYGYSGPLSTSYQLSFLNKAWKTFFDDCQKAGIISGLIRFNPFLENHLTVQNQSFIDLVREKKIVYSTMLNDYMHYFDKFSVNVKKNLKNSNNLDFVISEKINSKNIEEFKKIYFKLMNKKKADDNYYFDDNYFDNLLFKLPNNTGMISVIHKNKLIGAIIYLRFDTKIHIHLSAVDVEFRNKGISYVLRSHIFKLFQKTNYSQK